jgi:shikimate dehydrogenase
MIITTETKIFGSFSKSPSNNGAKFFNETFQKNNINAIYLPVKCEITKDVFSVIRFMNFSGAALSSPHKISALNFVDVLDNDAMEIGSINTVVVKNGVIYGYNTDWVGVYTLLKPLNLKNLYIYGRGGFSLAVQYVCKKLDISFVVLGRNDTIPNDEIYVFNSTPSTIQRDNVIDGRPITPTGFEIFLEQAKKQYEIYLDVKYE